MMHSEVVGLAQEISSDIVRCSDEDKTLVRSEIEQLHHEAARERNPDVAYVTLLYRKFSSMVTAQSHERGGPLSSFGWLERVLSEGSNPLRLRAITTVFALITFAVMASAPFIGNKEFNPDLFFHRGCAFRHNFSGSFNFRAYQLVIAVGVIAFVANGAYLVHYYLPKDNQGRKYLPGWQDLFGMVTGNASWAQNASYSCGVFCEEHGSFMLMLVDAIVVILAVGSFIAASVIYQAIVSTKVYVVYDQVKLPVAVEEFYTLSSCYMTYAKKSPACLDEGLDPTPKIVASLVMLFFCTVCLFLCLMVSWKEFGIRDAQQLFSRLLSSQQGPLTTESQHARTFLIEERDEGGAAAAGRGAARTMPGVVAAGAGAGSGAALEEGDYVDL